MKSTLLGAAVLMMTVCSSSASAAPITWVLQDVTFTDGGTASGSFEFDASTLAYSNINLFASGVGTYLFRALGTSFFLTAVDSNAADLTGANMLQLTFAAALTNAGGTVAITPSSFNFSFKGVCGTANCGSTSSATFLTGGSVTAHVVSEPGTTWLIALGALGLAAAKRRAR